MSEGLIQEREGPTQVKARKTDKEFAADLTTTAAEIKPDRAGRVTVEGALPQVVRKPVIDKTVNGMRRVNY